MMTRTWSVLAHALSLLLTPPSQKEHRHTWENVRTTKFTIQCTATELSSNIQCLLIFIAFREWNADFSKSKQSQRARVKEKRRRRKTGIHKLKNYQHQCSRYGNGNMWIFHETRALKRLFYGNWKIHFANKREIFFANPHICNGIRMANGIRYANRTTINATYPMRIAIEALHHFSFVVSLEILIRSEARALPFDENFIITATLLPGACMQRVRGCDFHATCTTIELTSNPNSKSVIRTRVILALMNMRTCQMEAGDFVVGKKSTTPSPAYHDRSFGFSQFHFDVQ